MIWILLAELLFSILSGVVTYISYYGIVEEKFVTVSYRLSSVRFFKSIRPTYIMYFTDNSFHDMLVINKQQFNKLDETTNHEAVLLKTTYKHDWQSPNGKRVNYALDNKSNKQVHIDKALTLSIFTFVAFAFTTICIYYQL